MREYFIVGLVALFAWLVVTPAASKTVRLEATTFAVKPLSAELSKPKGAGPFPAVVLLHGCNGLSASYRSWARQFVRWGYVALLVDSFRPRGLKHGVCRLRFRKWVSKQLRAKDAYLGLKYLTTLSFVDVKRIGVMGWSNGGVATLAAVNKYISEWTVEDAGANFSAAIAFYPECGIRYGGWSVTRRDRGGRVGPVVSTSGRFETLAPLLILIGDKDDWTPAKYCRQMLEKSKGQDISLKVYRKRSPRF